MCTIVRSTVCTVQYSVQYSAVKYSVQFAVAELSSRVFRVAGVSDTWSLCREEHLSA